MYKLDSYVVGLVLVFYFPLMTSHPQCLDYRPPFNTVAGKLKFCHEYSEFGCCTKDDDARLETMFKNVVSKVDEETLYHCEEYINEILCQECSPYAAHIYDAEITQIKRPLPGLCQTYCHEFYGKCKTIVKLLTNDTGVLNSLQSVEQFCRKVSIVDKDYCFPELLTNDKLNSNISRPRWTSEGCLCLEEFASEMSMPLAFRTPPDGTGRIFIGEQTGLIYIFYKNRKKLAEPFLNISESVLNTDKTGDERGLLGFAFHPNFIQNGYLYVYYSTGTLVTQYIRISRFTIEKDDPNKVDPESEKPILEQRQPHWNHNGGELFFGEDGYLYLCLGDGGAAGDPYNNAQNKSTLLGKVLRIDVDTNDPDVAYSIPPDNPFVNDKDARPEIYAYGIRNIWKCDVDEGDPISGENRGRIICGDVGQSAWEEIDVIEKGGNYGWNAREGPACYNNKTCNKVGPEVFPIYAYRHTVGKSVTGGHVYRGCMNPNLQGLYIFGDFMFGRLFSLREDKETKRWTNKELLMCGTDVCFNGLLGQYEKYIISFGEDDDGEIYLLTTAWPSTGLNLGKVYKIIDPRRRGDPATCRSKKRELYTHTNNENTRSIATTRERFAITTCIMIPVMSCVTYFV